MSFFLFKSDHSKIQTKIHKIAVFRIPETRRDRKNLASDLKSAPKFEQNSLNILRYMQ